MKSKIGLSVVLCLLMLPGMGWAKNNSPWKIGRQEGVFLMMSDIHFNPFDDPSLIKRLVAAPVEEWQSILETSTHKTFPGYDADPNYALVTSSLDKAMSLGVKYDYAIITGDYLSHNFKKAFQKYVSGDSKALKDFSTKTAVFVARIVQSRLSGVPVYFAVGNHDSECDNYEMTASDDLWKVLAQEWTAVASDETAAANFVHGGYYAVPHPTLKNHEIVALNSVFWAKKYEGGCKTDPADPGVDEMNWLQKVLRDAKARHQMVSLTMHLPPGVKAEKAEAKIEKNKLPKTYWKPEYEAAFAKLLRMYGDVIEAGFAGHSHMDDFRVDTIAKGKPLFFHICPGVCQIDGNNPGFQIMLYSKKDGSFKDMATYYVADLKAGVTGKEAWSLEYVFDETYGFKAYNSENLLTLAGQIGSDPAVRQKFDEFYSMKTPADQAITEKNWKFFNCSQTHIDPVSFVECLK
ncbi:MAG TPA: metallophosphoesterase [bacterium]|nr:metallophosphoesterase [bacterium]